jgi:hypothetical protein
MILVTVHRPLVVGAHPPVGRRQACGFPRKFRQRCNLHYRCPQATLSSLTAESAHGSGASPIALRTQLSFVFLHFSFGC